MASNPKISVVMPAYNSGAFIAEAIKSILMQTFQNFEFIIINDGSTDNTEEVILSFTDERIKYFAHCKNLGNNITRTEGLSMSLGKYIAIMDSDDISNADRLEKQYIYFESHPETDILGGGVQWFGDTSPKYEYPPHDSAYIQSAIFFKNRIMQPTVMFRKDSFIEQNLSWLPEWENMGDYELWCRASQSGLKFENLQDILLKYRKSDTQIGSRNLNNRLIKLEKFLRIRLMDLDLNFSENEHKLLFDFIRTRIEINEEKFNVLKELFNNIEAANDKINRYPLDSFKAALLFYRLRLEKYYYWENKKYARFLQDSIKNLYDIGWKATLLFWKNEIKNK